MDSNNTKLFRKEGQTQVVDAQGNLQNFGGNLDTLPIYKQQNNVITSDALTPKTKIDLSGIYPNQQTGDGLVNSVTDSTKAFDTEAAYQKELELQKLTKPDSTQLDTYLNNLLDAEQGLTGRGAEQTQAEINAGIPEANKARSSIQGQIKTQIAEYNAMKAERDQIIADIEAGAGRKGLTTAAVLGQTGAQERQYLARLNAKAAEIGILQAQDEALKGDIDTAQKNVDRAIDLKYQDREAEYTAWKNAYDRVKGTFDEEEKKRGEALAAAKKKEEEALKEKKEEEKSIQNMLIQASIYQAPASLLNQAKDIANKGGKPSDVARLLGKYSPDYLDYKLKKAQIYKTGVEAEKADLELKQTKNAIKAAENSTGVSFAMLSEKQQDTTLKLRDKYNAESKDFVTIRDSYNRVQASSQNPSAAGDLALIFNYMKILDPGSVVREGEFATAQNAAGIPERVRAQYNKAIRGERLTDTTRSDFVSRAGDLFRAQQSEQQKINDNYSFLAASANIPKEFIVRDITSAVSSEQEALDNAWKATVPNTTNSTSLLDQFIQKNSSLYGQPTN